MSPQVSHFKNCCAALGYCGSAHLALINNNICRTNLFFGEVKRRFQKNIFRFTERHKSVIVHVAFFELGRHLFTTTHNTVTQQYGIVTDG